ncbi:cofilin [Angomonas deanei]|nr:cofilin [Angomonas deanei]|eukprot:EPY36991.1 cofilin [Angomonas deanei]
MAMSGVTLASNVVGALNDLRMKKSRYVILAIGDDGKQVEVKEVGARGSSFEDFQKKLDASNPCYGAVDFEYEDGGKRDKLVLVQWIPEGAKPRSKMLYSASRDALNSASEGYLAIQANDASDVTLEEIVRRIKSHRGN